MPTDPDEPETGEWPPPDEPEDDDEIDPPSEPDDDPEMSRADLWADWRGETNHLFHVDGH